MKVPVTGSICAAISLSRAIIEQHSQAILHHLLCDGLTPSESARLSIDELIRASHPTCSGPLPSVTVAVCTRDRTESLARCLNALSQLDYEDLELLVIDNAPTSDSSERLVETRYPNIRYVREHRPGLNWARNRAILEARGEIIAYTDDDAVPDAGWVRALAEVFAEDPEVMAVTGLVVPYELEVEPQILFERYAGFGRGFERRWYRVAPEKGSRVATLHGRPGKFGTGANMAYRRSLFNRIGYFDPALDMGTATIGGGDLEMFFRVLKEGYALAYEPAALVRHCHRHDYDELRTQITGWGTGFYAYLIRSALFYPDERLAFVGLGLLWLWRLHIRRLLVSCVHPPSFMKDLVLAQVSGAFGSLKRYKGARKSASEISRTWGPLVGDTPARSSDSRNKPVHCRKGVAERTVDMSQRLETITDVKDYAHTRLFVTRDGRLLGRVDIPNDCQTISAAHLRDAIVRSLRLDLLETDGRKSPDLVRAEAISALIRHYTPTQDESPGEQFSALPAHVPVSIVVATRNRPEELRNCLRCLLSQESPRRVEIIVADNDPGSGLTAPVVAEFPGILVIHESRQGISYARNAGITASTGDIVVTTDDDVTTPTDWLEKLLAPFVRNDVMIATGNVLPLELETRAQELFEAYGGLGGGFERLEADGDWFRSFRRYAVPAWRLGSTANAAFRGRIFEDPEIGLFHEALGAGTPAGYNESTYLFYKVLQAGYTIVYEPAAFVWHRHRRDMQAFRRQIYRYSKGHVAYHLMTMTQDQDLRAILRLVIGLPKAHLWRAKERICGRSIYPVRLILREILGNIIGPFALWQSCRQVKRLGRSRPYAPASQRSVVAKN